MNIFQEILHKEDNTTEILTNLLYYKPFRIEFLDFLGIKEDIKFENFYTQYNLDQDSDSERKNRYGIIDLFIDDDKKYLVEIKINSDTKLTDHQKKGSYIEYLNGKKENLFYLIPRSYFHKDDIEGKILYWEDFLKRIKNSELDKMNPLIEHFVSFFYSYFSIDIIYKFEKRELQLIFGGKTMPSDTTIPRIIKKLEEIVENVKNSEIKVDRSKKDFTKQHPNYYGYYVKDDILTKYNLILWYGIDFDIWEDKSYPLIISIESYDNNEKLLKKIFSIFKNKGFEKYEYDNDENDTYIIIFGYKKDDFGHDLDFKVETYKNKILETKDTLINILKSTTI